MNTYYVTFGQKYRREDHPQGGHPDGYATIHAPSYETARETAFKHLGSTWAFIYEADELNHEDYERGELMTFSYE